MRQRGAATSTRRAGRGRGRGQGHGDGGLPSCPQGSRCPYIDEYQHRSEFSHSYVPPPQPDPGVVPYSGGGQRLGGSSQVSSVLLTLHDQAVQNGLLQRQLAGATAKTPKRCREEEIIDITTPSPRSAPAFIPAPMPPSPEDCVLCGICGAAVAFTGLEAHMANHDQRAASKSLQAKQDEEYAESILTEVLQASAEDAARQREAQAQSQLAQQQALRQARSESIRRHRIETMHRAREALLTEPTAGPVVSVRFTLPSGLRVARKFRPHRCIQDCFDYLATLEELSTLRYSLREVIGSRALHPPVPSSCTFLSFGLHSNSALIVVVKDEDEDDTEEVETKAETEADTVLEVAPLPHLPERHEQRPLRREAQVVDLTDL